jgi:hypothetical protein
MVMAYLFKHTPLQINFNVNLTCLIPTENPEVGRPERLDLKAMLWHFLHFRLDVVTRRLEHERVALERRIHLLEGFEGLRRARRDPPDRSPLRGQGGRAPGRSSSASASTPSRPTRSSS